MQRVAELFLVLMTGSAAAAGSWPGVEWLKASPAEMGLDERQLVSARGYALTGEGSGLIVYRGKAVMQWGDQKQRYDLKSTTKSFGAAALGIALKDGKMRLDDKARRYHPSLGTPPETNSATGWLDEITILHLASQTAGFEKPGGYTPLLFRPGTQWDYSDSGPNWLAECVTLAYRRDLDELMFERVFGPIGIQRNDLVWRKNQYRPALIEGVMRREFGAGISANVEAMARFGYLHLRGGEWDGKEILPRSFIEQLRKPLPGPPLPVRKPEEYGEASGHYGLLWWNNVDGTLAKVPRDAFWTWGLYDSLIVVIPSLDIVVARAGEAWRRENGGEHYDPLQPFLEPIALSVKAEAKPREAVAYPTSPVIKAIGWDSEEVIRLAKGSDNWPLTWADDDALYTAYGDGNGFDPQLADKLSLGLAKVLDDPPNVTAVNLRSPTAEAKGDGKSGRKASGILMVDRVLYLFVRNVGNAQLGWSTDHGATWTWADWKFTKSFGCPTFLNFGRNYAGARDEFVYIYSPDSHSAYERADQMVLARVQKSNIRAREAYEFLAKLDDQGQPLWTNQIQERGAVFVNPGNCYRSGITYNPYCNRYLWCQSGSPFSTAGSADARFSGALTIYDAPEPWGPWTTAYFSPKWDIGPGETSSIPTKWMKADGTFYLVFSGNDAFSLRKGIITTRSRER